MVRPERTDLRARHCLLSDVHSPCGVWGITNWSLVASGGENFDKRCRDFRRRQNRGISEILGGRRLKSPDRCLFNRAKRVMNGRGLTECRSAADASWQSSDTALPIRASLLTACPAEVLPGVLFVRVVQREFEDLLAVLIFSPVRWV